MRFNHGNRYKINTAAAAVDQNQFDRISQGIKHITHVLDQTNSVIFVISERYVVTLPQYIGGYTIYPQMQTYL